MMPRRCLATLALAVFLVFAPRVLATAELDEQASANLTVHVQLASRTSVRLSSTMAYFDVTDAARGATADIDFLASARTRDGGEVLLTIEPAGELRGPTGSADSGSVVTFMTAEDGRYSGLLTEGSPRLAARWIGSGVRHGRLVLALHGAANPGSYRLPINVMISTP